MTATVTKLETTETVNTTGSREVANAVFRKAAAASAQEEYRNAHANGVKVGRRRARKAMESQFGDMTNDEIVDLLLSEG